MQILILCGGLAARLMPITKNIPKSMVLIGKKPFLEHQIKLLKKNGISDIVLCIGHKGVQIEKYFGNGRKFGVNIQYGKDGKKLLGTGGAIKKAEKLLQDDFLIIYGDSYLPFNFQKAIKFFKKNNKLGMMTVFKNKNKYEPSNVEVEGKLVKHYAKNLPAGWQAKKMEYIDYGLSIFKKETLKYIPKNKFYDLSKLHSLLIKNKELLAYPAEKRFYQIGSFEGLEEFKRYIKK
ncbi:MAG: sugar phosphate nucleotidyltransferase [Patescibacteria group bacterium]